MFQGRPIVYLYNTIYFEGYIYIYYSGGGGTGSPKLYQCVININSGLNIVLEFTLEGLLFENFHLKLISMMTGKMAVGASRACPPHSQISLDPPPTHKFLQFKLIYRIAEEHRIHFIIANSRT